MTGMVPQYLSDLDESERAALSNAARDRLARCKELFPGAAEDSDEFAFLEIIASGEVFDQ